MHLETDSLVLSAGEKEKERNNVRKSDPNFCIYYAVHIKHNLFIPIQRELYLFLFISLHIYFVHILKPYLPSKQLVRDHHGSRDQSTGRGGVLNHQLTKNNRKKNISKVTSQDIKHHSVHPYHSVTSGLYTADNWCRQGMATISPLPTTSFMEKKKRMANYNQQGFLWAFTLWVATRDRERPFLCADKEWFSNVCHRWRAFLQSPTHQ